MTYHQNMARMCWNRAAVTEFEFTVRQTIMETGWRVYVGWLRRLRAEAQTLIKVSHTAQTSSIWRDIIIRCKLSPMMKRRRKRGSNHQVIPKVVDSDTCQGVGQTGHMCTNTHTYTHSLKEQNNTNRKDQLIHNLSLRAEHLSHSITALTQSKIHLIKIGSFQFSSKRISQWWKL